MSRYSVSFLVVIAVLIVACGAREPVGPPYILKNPRIEERVLGVDLERMSANEPDPNEPVSLLVCYHVADHIDIVKLGEALQRAIALPDEHLGGDVLFGALVGSEPDDYIGAWWASDIANQDWRSRDTVHMKLHRRGQSGVMMGEGQITAAIVRGRFGQAPFESLSEPVTFPHVGETPLPQASPEE